MNKEPIQFYPKHPTDEKTQIIATVDSPLLEQDQPIDSAELYHLFCSDLNRALEIYGDKRFAISGTAIKVGPDGHQKPSVQLSDCAGGRCHVLCVFPSEDVYSKVSVGDRVTVRGNYLVMCNHYGIVIKKSEIIASL